MNYLLEAEGGHHVRAMTNSETLVFLEHHIANVTDQFLLTQLNKWKNDLMIHRLQHETIVNLRQMIETYEEPNVRRAIIQIINLRPQTVASACELIQDLKEDQAAELLEQIQEIFSLGGEEYALSIDSNAVDYTF
ncbi:hypothetical protein PCE1_000333 [Barthelona sp. PCE]